MSRDTALVIALILAAAGTLAGEVGLLPQGQIVVICAAFVYMAYAVQLAAPLGLALAGLLAVALAPFIEPSRDAAS